MVNRSILEKINKYARTLDFVTNVIASLSLEYDEIAIINSEGKICLDKRPLIHLGINIVINNNGTIERGSSGLGGRFSLKKLTMKNIFKHIKKAVGMMTPFENKLKEMKCKTNFRLNELVELLSSHDFVCYARGLGQLSVLYRRLASKGILTKLVECASRIDTGKINTDIVKLWAQDPSSILIMPTQRIAKWPLFFKELLKKVEENPDHPLLDAVTVGHSLTRIAADHVNLMILLVDHNEDLTH